MIIIKAYKVKAVFIAAIIAVSMTAGTVSAITTNTTSAKTTTTATTAKKEFTAAASTIKFKKNSTIQTYKSSDYKVDKDIVIKLDGVTKSLVNSKGEDVYASVNDGVIFVPSYSMAKLIGSSLNTDKKNQILCMGKTTSKKDAKTGKTVKITTTLEAWAGGNSLIINGKSAKIIKKDNKKLCVYLDRDNQNCIPLTATLSTFGYSYKYDAKTKTLNITSPKDASNNNNSSSQVTITGGNVYNKPGEITTKIVNDPNYKVNKKLSSKDALRYEDATHPYPNWKYGDPLPYGFSTNGGKNVTPVDKDGYDPNGFKGGYDREGKTWSQYRDAHPLSEEEKATWPTSYGGGSPDVM